MNRLRIACGVAVLLIALVVVIRNVRCFGDCTRKDVIDCVAKGDADCLLLSAFDAYVARPSGREGPTARELATAAVAARKEQSLLGRISNISFVAPEKASSIIDEMFDQYLRADRVAEAEVLWREVETRYGAVPLPHTVGDSDELSAEAAAFVESHRMPRGALQTLDSAPSADRADETDVPLARAELPNASLWRSSRRVVLRNAAEGFNAVGYEARRRECNALPNTGEFRLTPTAAGKVRIAHFRELFSDDFSASAAALRRVQPLDAQMYLMLTLPQDVSMRVFQDARLSGDIGKRLKVELASSLRKTQENSHGPFIPMDSSDLPEWAKASYFTLLLIDWIKLESKAGRESHAYATAADLLEILVRLRQRRSAGILRRPDARASAYALHLFPLTYVLAQAGLHVLPMTYVRSLPPEDLDLKAELAFCVLYGLADGGRFTDAIEFVHSLSSAAVPANLQLGGHLEQLNSCTNHLVIAESCKTALVALLQRQHSQGGDEQVTMDIELIDDVERVRLGAASLYELLVSDFGIMLAQRQQLDDRWTEVLEYVRLRLGLDAARVADTYHRLRLSDLSAEALAGISRVGEESAPRNPLKVTREPGSALEAAALRYRLAVLVSQGKDLDALRLAVDSDTEDDALITSTTASAIRRGGSAALLNYAITDLSDRPSSRSRSAAAASILKGMLARGDYDEAIRLYSLTGHLDGRGDRRKSIAIALARADRTSLLVKFLRIVDLEDREVVSVALAVLPYLAAKAPH